MKKDDKIEQRFREYFGGNETPDCDLTQAKRIVLAERAAKKRRAKIFLRFASAFACVAIVFTACVLYLPSVFGKKGDMNGSPNGDTAEAPGDSPNGGNSEPGTSFPSEGNAPGEATLPGDNNVVDGETQYPSASKIKYSLSKTTARPIGYDEVQANYADKTGIFSPFEWASNASCTYTLYEYEEKAVLLCAELRYSGGMQKFDASVYIDLTEERYTAEDFDAYRTLGADKIKTEYLNGEFVSYGYTVSDNTQYYTQVTSPQQGAAEFLMKFLKK